MIRHYEMVILVEIILIYVTSFGGASSTVY